MSILTTVKIDARDIAVRAAHTFWQAFLGALASVYVLAATDVHQVTDIASAKKFALALVAAVVAAAASALKTTIKQLTAKPLDTTADPPVGAKTAA